MLIASSLVLTCSGALADKNDEVLERAKRLLEQSILIDGHNDLPWAIRSNKEARGDLAAYDLRGTVAGQTDHVLRVMQENEALAGF